MVPRAHSRLGGAQTPVVFLAAGPCPPGIPPLAVGPLPHGGGLVTPWRGLEPVAGGYPPGA